MLERKERRILVPIAGHLLDANHLPNVIRLDAVPVLHARHDAVLGPFPINANRLCIGWKQVDDGRAVQPDVLGLELALFGVRPIEKHLNLESIWIFVGREALKPVEIDEPEFATKTEVFLYKPKPGKRVGAVRKKSFIAPKASRLNAILAANGCGCVAIEEAVAASPWK